MHDVIQMLVDKKVSLSPLAGVSDMAFRLMCRKFGCPYAFTEMIDARAILSARQSTFLMMATNDEDTPLGVQIVGDKIDDIVEAAKVCRDRGIDMININAACPVPKIKRKGKGVAMMNEPDKIGVMLRRLVQATELPVVLKIRSGFNQDSLNYMEVSQRAEDEGAAAIFIHPRHAEAKYAGPLSKEHIVEMKQKLKIPVFASGNLLKAQDVINMLNDTGCDGVSIARGSMGQPWIFAQSLALLEGRKPMEKPSLDEIKAMVKEHFALMCQVHPFDRALPRMYKHLTWYFTKHKRLDELMRRLRADVGSEEQFATFVEQF